LETNSGILQSAILIANKIKEKNNNNN